jgi:transcriptional regulator with XRE-family HTH domain
MVLLRQLLGDALRRLRLRQGRTLREVSATARVSLGYLSEVERGRKEASSELLASICDALGAPLSQVLREVSDGFALAELQNEPAFSLPLEPALAGESAPAGTVAEEPVPAGSAASANSAMPAASRGTALRLAQSAIQQPGRPQQVPQRMVIPPRKISVRSGAHLAQAEPLIEQVKLSGTEPKFDKLARDITDMVPV